MQQTNKNWNWYGVKIIKQIVVECEPDKNFVNNSYEKQSFEESVLLIKARSCSHACKKTEIKAKKDNDFYFNADGQRVTWWFIKVIDCYLILDGLQSGAELYSCIHTTDKNMTADEFLEKYFKQE